MMTESGTVGTRANIPSASNLSGLLSLPKNERLSATLPAPLGGVAAWEDWNAGWMHRMTHETNMCWNATPSAFQPPLRDHRGRWPGGMVHPGRRPNQLQAWLSPSPSSGNPCWFGRSSEKHAVGASMKLGKPPDASSAVKPPRKAGAHYPPLAVCVCAKRRKRPLAVARPKGESLLVAWQVTSTA